MHFMSNTESTLILMVNKLQNIKKKQKPKYSLSQNLKTHSFFFNDFVYRNS